MSGKSGRSVAIVGIGHSLLSRNSGQSVGALALRASRDAIRDAGLDRSRIDGVSAIFSTDIPTVWPGYVVQNLGLSNVVYSNSATPPSANAVVNGVHAVAAGASDYCLCYHAKYRWDVTSSSARKDPLRRSPPMAFDPQLNNALIEPYAGAMGIAAHMRRHMHEFGSRREHFGMIAVNNRTHAQKNPRAVFRNDPLNMDGYLAAPLIYDPFTMLDMDAPIDGAQAVIVTTVERAADLAHRPVIVEAASNGITGRTDMQFQPFDHPLAAKLMMDRLWADSGYKLQDMDILNLYDGFTIIALDWLEAAYGERGIGPSLLEDAWDPATGTLKFFGKARMTTHGGNLSEGRVQGMGHVCEAVEQLRGNAGDRQVPDAKVALVTNGNNPVNAGLVLSVG